MLIGKALKTEKKKSVPGRRKGMEVKMSRRWLAEDGEVSDPLGLEAGDKAG